MQEQIEGRHQTDMQDGSHKNQSVMQEKSEFNTFGDALVSLQDVMDKRKQNQK
jgi:hypothetical protein